MHPRLFEETVASVFASVGFTTIVTAYSGDGGIDVVLEKNGEEIGVQVKRYKDRISVEQIRSLCGALVLRGLTQGIFVTTSSFQSGAEGTAAKFAKKGYKIDLMDSQRFYDVLRLAQSNTIRDMSEEAASRYLLQLESISDVVVSFCL
ncbi:restriction endonuclease [Roseiarcaceae bacterium H3SJ34-1]|uniref:restriction endonuclease n=1 Tax=Terripilifer ovatus TaxID=3032367 RepID=UPI003AB98F2C|nr:restriction endonuclease [Roseiarcaceae bacterium H3SJ34-1]